MNRHFHGVGKQLVVLHLINAYISFILGVRSAGNFRLPPTRTGDLAPSGFHQKRRPPHPAAGEFAWNIVRVSGQTINERVKKTSF